MQPITDRQFEKLSEIWHRLLKIHSELKLEKQFPNLQGMSNAEIGILRIVSENKDIILKDINQQLQLPKSTLTNTINRLEKQGYLHRLISNRDLRSYCLELTEKGMLVQKEHCSYEKLIMTGFLQALDSDEERDELLRMLQKISVAICNQTVETL